MSKADKFLCYLWIGATTQSTLKSYTVFPGP